MDPSAYYTTEEREKLRKLCALIRETSPPQGPYLQQLEAFVLELLDELEGARDAALEACEEYDT